MEIDNISPEKVKTIIKRDYPNFEIESIKILKSGWDNSVFEINNDYIFRFPKKENKGLKNEIKIIKYLNDIISLKIPVNDFVGKKDLYVGYKKIIGQPLNQDIIKSLSDKEKKLVAEDIANFFYEFHSSLPISLAKKFDIQSNTRDWWPPVIERLIIKIKDKKIKFFLRENLIRYLTMMENEPDLVIAYNDLHENNIAFNYKKRKIEGIFDFGYVSIEDINKEFYYLCLNDLPLVIETVKQYNKLSGKEVDIKKVYLTAVVGGAAMLAIHSDNPKTKEYRDAMDKLIVLFNAENQFLF
jgi:aminoglycoside 2''-phosphotransferase